MLLDQKVKQHFYYPLTTALHCIEKEHKNHDNEKLNSFKLYLTPHIQ